MISQDGLKKVLRYDPKTGVFVWLKSANGKIGKVAGSRNRKSQIQIDGRYYYSSRLAWLYVYGAFPSHYIDHIDRDPTNNKISNLRKASRSQNGRNTSIYKNNSSGIKGVSFEKSRRRWKASIRINSRKITIGYFLTKELARDAYTNMARKHFGEFA